MDSISGTGANIGFLSPKNETVQKALGYVPIGIAAFAVWHWVVPILLVTLVGTVKVAALIGILWVFGLMVFQKKFRWSIGFLVQRFVDLLASVIVNRDPIGVMKYYLGEVNRNIQELSESIGDLRGSLVKAHKDLGQAQRELEQNEGKVRAAKQQGMETSPAARTAANIALRRSEIVKRIEGEIQQGERAVQILDVYHEKAVAYRDDLQDNISTTQAERKRVKTSSRAFKAAARILHGQSTGAEMYHDAVEANDEQMSALVGEMAQFVSESRGIIDGFTLERDGAVQQVLARLEKREQSSLLLTHQPQSVGVPLSAPATKEPAGIIPIDDFLKQ